MTERSDAADMIEPRLANEPIENADPNDPMLPIESIEPIDPMDRIDPRDPMLRIEPSDLIDNKDRCAISPSSLTTADAQRVQERALGINSQRDGGGCGQRHVPGGAGDPLPAAGPSLESAYAVDRRRDKPS
jgi:hypothetical protein